MLERRDFVALLAPAKLVRSSRCKSVRDCASKGPLRTGFSWIKGDMCGTEAIIRIFGTRTGVNEFYKSLWSNLCPCRNSATTPMLTQRIMQRWRKNSAPNLWQFGLNARDVILERSRRAVRGQLTAGEARRMIMEKQTAAIQAQLAYIQALFHGDPALASRRFFDVYHRAVQSNRKRLRKRSWQSILGGS